MSKVDNVACFSPNHVLSLFLFHSGPNLQFANNLTVLPLQLKLTK